MKVILLQDVKALGKKGQTVDVSDGYARNCILPKKLGVEATSKTLMTLNYRRHMKKRLLKSSLKKPRLLQQKWRTWK